MEACYKPASDTVEGMDLFLDDVAASGAQARMLDVENDLIFDFLDHNVEAVVRDYVKHGSIQSLQELLAVLIWEM